MYLKHYGILGMRWGIRRFQDKSGRLTRAGQKRYSDKNSKKRFQFTESQKRAIKIGLAVAGTGLAAYGLYRLSQNGRFDSIINKGKAFAAENSKDIIGSAVPKYDPVTGFKLKDKPTQNTIEHLKEDIRKINPKFYDRANDLVGRYRNNCVACAIGFDMRERGFDTEANPSPIKKDGTVGGFDILHSFQKYYKTDRTLDYLISDPKDDRDALEKVSKELLRHGEGSRGILFGQYKPSLRPKGGGHCIAWKVMNGQLYFIESQNGTVYDDPYTYVFSRFRRDMINFARTDDLEINPEGMKNLVRNK